MNKEWASVLALFGVLALPYTTAIKFDSVSNINEQVRTIPLFIFVSFALAILSILIIKYDKPLGWFCIYISLYNLWLQTPLGISQTTWFVAAAGILCVLRLMPVEFATFAKYGLIASGCVQVLYSLVQMFQFDPLFFGFVKAPLKFVHGTFGHHNFLGAFFAITAPLYSAKLLFIPLFGLIMSNSALSFVAAGIAIFWKYRKTPLIWPYTLGVVSLMIFLFHWKSWDSYYSRKAVWIIAFGDFDRDWKTLLFGMGLGEWYNRIPLMMSKAGAEDLYFQAHNDYIQLLYETGVIGLAFLAWWLCTWKKGFANGLFIALAISCAGMYTLHLATLASTALLTIALATRKDEECLENSSHRYYL